MRIANTSVPAPRIRHALGLTILVLLATLPGLSSAIEGGESVLRTEMDRQYETLADDLRRRDPSASWRRRPSIRLP